MPVQQLKEMSRAKSTKMQPMGFFEHAFAYITLGLLVGWYYFLLILYPVLIGLSIYGSYVAMGVLATFIILSITPLKHEPWEPFMYSWIFRVWRDYFDYSYDISSVEGKIKEGEKYIYFEFPHGIFPMGQFLSASLIKDISPNKMITGTAADAVFFFPIMRQMMAWIGTQRANRKGISTTFKKGFHCAIVPGGIAEMYLVSEDSENLYLKKRAGTVRAAIQEGAHIIPTFFFGNSRLVTVVAGKGSTSWLSKMSRKLRASVLFFHGRHFLPVPYRHPLKMVTGDVIEVKQNDNPSEEEVNIVLNKVIAGVKKLYDEKKPEWETRPLVIN
jgi:hypothetical protein